MAGLLDLLTGQGGGQGLLDLLRANALNQAMPSGLPSDTADYGRTAPMSFAAPIIGANQPSPLDTAQWPSGPVGAPSAARAEMSSPVVKADQPNSLDAARWPAGPVGAPSNANAAMRQNGNVSPNVSAVAPPAAAPAADASTGFGDRLMLGTKGFLGNMGAGPIGALAGGLGALITGQPTDPSTIEAQKTARTNNATARALIAKGADPAAVAAAAGNPELLKTLIGQHFGPQNIDNLGNGYIRDRNTGKVTRAYEPEAKPPTSLGAGYIWNPETGKVERAYTPEENKGPSKDIAEREKALLARGMDPKDPRNQQFVMTGKYPREDAQPLTATDKKFIEEADDGIFASRTAITALNTAKKLSKDANSGYFAGARASVGNSLPDAMVPDFISSPKSSDATVNYENVVLGQALAQLKSIFGAAPTEGERKILVELQASVSKPDRTRQEILDRAIELAQRKLDYNKQRADALRGGTFYKKGYDVDGSPAAAGPSAGSYVWTPDKGLQQQ